MGVSWDNQNWVVWSIDHVQKGKGASFMQIELRNVANNRIVKSRFRPDEQLDEIFFERKKMEYLYRNGSDLVLMDPESYDQVEVSAELVGDRDVFLIENCQLEVAFIEGQCIQIELPNTVTLTITDTPPQVKGATATNQLKDAVCDSGAKVKVPPFVENGEQINVDTRTGEYLGRT
jgi:elongation factor P